MFLSPLYLQFLHVLEQSEAINKKLYKSKSETNKILECDIQVCKRPWRPTEFLSNQYIIIISKENYNDKIMYLERSEILYHRDVQSTVFFMARWWGGSSFCSQLTHNHFSVMVLVSLILFYFDIFRCYRLEACFFFLMRESIGVTQIREEEGRNWEKWREGKLKTAYIVWENYLFWIKVRTKRI